MKIFLDKLQMPEKSDILRIFMIRNKQNAEQSIYSHLHKDVALHSNENVSRNKNAHDFHKMEMKTKTNWNNTEASRDPFRTT